MLLQGTITAIVTPMKSDGAIDFGKLVELIEWQISQNIDGLVIAGSTGEAATLSHKEKLLLLQIAHEIVNRRVPLVAGTGTNSTHSSIELTHEAMQIGYDYSLLTCPYYNKPTQRGLFLHYQAIADAVPKMQHLLYSIPGRSVIRIETSTVIQLSQIKNIIGIKDSGSSAERIQELRQQCAANFAILSGDDDFALECIRNGGNGVISVASNALPKQMSHLIQAGLNNDFSAAEAINQRLQAIFKELFCQSNPIPVKAVIYYLGKIDNGIRLPLTWLEEQYLSALIQAYQEACK